MVISHHNTDNIIIKDLFAFLPLSMSFMLLYKIFMSQVSMWISSIGNKFSLYDVHIGLQLNHEMVHGK